MAEREVTIHEAVWHHHRSRGRRKGESAYHENTRDLLDTSQEGTDFQGQCDENENLGINLSFSITNVLTATCYHHTHQREQQILEVCVVARWEREQMITGNRRSGNAVCKQLDRFMIVILSLCGYLGYLKEKQNTIRQATGLKSRSGKVKKRCK